MKKIVWISSYPKSGNTFLRAMLSAFFYSKDGTFNQDYLKNIKKYDGFIALGCVIKGQTPHFEFISSSVTDIILNMSVKNKKPIGNGIITCLNKKQAIARSKKGAEAANAMLSVLSQ